MVSHYQNMKLHFKLVFKLLSSNCTVFLFALTQFDTQQHRRFETIVLGRRGVPPQTFRFTDHTGSVYKFTG